nr:MAG TPA_asm: hypothetical protein [Caudoviricetes sp.]
MPPPRHCVSTQSYWVCKSYRLGGGRPSPFGVGAT